MQFVDVKPEGPVYLHFYDATNPEARRFIWERVCEGYYRYGIKRLLARRGRAGHVAESTRQPALSPGQRAGGDATSTPCCTRRASTKACAARARPRSSTWRARAWAGSQRYGAAVWSGDIHSTFESLRAQVPRRAEHGPERHPLVDDRHRRLLQRRSRRPDVPRADRALVPVRRLLPALPAARLSARRRQSGPCPPAARTRSGRLATSLRDHPGS